MESLRFDSDAFVGLLRTLIGHAEHLQNSPPDLIPKEDLAADAVVKFLAPYTKPNGPLEVRKCTYHQGRSNVILKYSPPGATKIVSFVGSHLDVVPANPEEWTVPPFELTQDGDKLSGRGVTDCLGHVAMISEFFRQLAVHQPKINTEIVAVFIASEENQTVAGVGVDVMAQKGELEPLKKGPLFWIDSANFGPTLGTAGVVAWQLDLTGKLFHSGLPHKAINCIEFASAVVQLIQKRFHEDFATGSEEERYRFITGCSLKPTQISIPKGGLNQIPGECRVQGDIRITPFHDPRKVMARVEQYLAEMDLSKLPSFGYGRYELPDENIRGMVKLKWLGEPWEGIAVDLESPAHKALCNAVKEVRGQTNEFSLTGSLPLVGDLQKAGFDVQITGFGRMEAYHAKDEFGYLSEFAQGFSVLASLVKDLIK